MKRRCVLGGALGLAATAVVAAADAVPPAKAAFAVLAHGPAGWWVGVDGESAARPLLISAAAIVVPAARGLWWLEGAQLTRWPELAAASAAPRPLLALPAPAQALAASDDGRWLATAEGEHLSLRDGDGREVRRHEGVDASGRRRGHATRLFHHAGRRSFVAAWPALGEWWEIPLDPDAPPIFDGLVHDYRLGEGLARAGFLGVRRIPLDGPMPDPAFVDRRVAWLAGRQDDDAVGIVHLDVRRRIATRRAPSARPHAAALIREGAAWQWWLPAGDDVLVIDPTHWQVIERLTMPGPVGAVASAGDVPHALVAGRGTKDLFAWRGGTWRPAPLPEGSARSIAAGAAASREGGPLWVATERPARLYALGPEGAIERRWTLPDDVVIDSVAALG